MRSGLGPPAKVIVICTGWPTTHNGFPGPPGACTKIGAAPESRPTPSLKSHTGVHGNIWSLLSVARNGQSPNVIRDQHATSGTALGLARGHPKGAPCKVPPASVPTLIARSLCLPDQILSDLICLFSKWPCVALFVFLPDLKNALATN